VEKEKTREVAVSWAPRGWEEKKTMNWVVDKEDWGKEEEMEIDHQKIETMVPKQFHWWLKVFGKVE